MKLKLKDIPGLVRNLTKEQRKIIYIALIVFAFFFLLWVTIYVPQSEKLVIIKANIADTERQIEQIMSVARGRDLANVAKELKISSDKIISKFPVGEDIVVAKLTDAAENTAKLMVNDITPATRQSLLGKIPGFELDELLLNMSITGEYKGIVEFLRMLLGDFPVFLRIKELSISGKGEGKSQLDCDIQLSAYLIKKR
jgi:Tfp pilus assembly protein PilO